MNVGDVIADTVNRGLGRYWKEDPEGHMYPAGNLNRDFGHAFATLAMLGMGLESVGKGSPSMTTAAAVLSLSAYSLGHFSDRLAPEGGANYGQF